MENNTVLWITIAAYIICLVVIGIVEGRKAKSIADLTVGGRNAGAWLSALSYGTAYFSAVMFVGYAGKTGLSFGLWGILAGLGNAVFGSLLAWLVLARRTREISGNLKAVCGISLLNLHADISFNFFKQSVTKIARSDKFSFSSCKRTVIYHKVH